MNLLKAMLAETTHVLAGAEKNIKNVVVSKIKKPNIFVTLGYPGSGKTFFSSRFAKDLRLFHLNSDMIRSIIFPKPSYTAQEFLVVFGMMDYIASELLKRGMGVIYDANVTKRIYRRRLQQMAQKYNARYLLLWFKTPEEVALSRIRKRDEIKSEIKRRYHKIISDAVLFKIKSTEEPPLKERHVIMKADSYQGQKETVLKFIKQ